MRRMIARALIALLAFNVLVSPARAADSTVSAMTAASAFSGTELTYIVQGGADRKGTPAQFAIYVYGLMTGDCTVTLSAITCTKTNGVAFTALATTAPGTGVATALGVNVGTAGAFVVNGGALGTPSSGTLTNASGLPIAGLTGLGTGVGTALAVNVGSAGSFITNGGALGTPSSGTLTNATGLPIGGITGLGTGVGAALGTALSANGGLTTTIASGTLALSTTAISSGACTAAQTATATNTATTDVVLASFNGDPTAVTGYSPATAGMLTIITYPTLNTFNAKVCNNTSSSITPGAITLNWRVLR